MAKRDKIIPTINAPSGGMMAWLNQDDSVEPAAEDAASNLKSDPEQVENFKTEVSAETSAVETPTTAIPATETPEINHSEQPAELFAEISQQPKDAVIVNKGEKVTNVGDKAGNDVQPPAVRKPKSKVGEGAKSGSYLETFFKKPVKPNGNSLAGDGKPVRVSEESHWLLSVLVNEARRQGYKLNVGDLIDNLLIQHRLEHKPEVDELIAKWKSRKSFD